MNTFPTQEFRALVAAAADAGQETAKRLSLQGRAVQLRLYYRPAQDGNAGALGLFLPEDAPETFVLASNDVLGGSVSYDS